MLVPRVSLLGVTGSVTKKRDPGSEVGPEGERLALKVINNYSFIPLGLLGAKTINQRSIDDQNGLLILRRVVFCTDLISLVRDNTALCLSSLHRVACHTRGSCSHMVHWGSPIPSGIHREGGSSVSQRRNLVVSCGGVFLNLVRFNFSEEM